MHVALSPTKRHNTKQEIYLCSVHKFHCNIFSCMKQDTVYLFITKEGKVHHMTIQIQGRALCNCTCRCFYNTENICCLLVKNYPQLTSCGLWAAIHCPLFTGQTLKIPLSSTELEQPLHKTLELFQ